MMHQPMARVVKLEYRDLRPKLAADTGAFMVHIRGPDGEMHEHLLKNGVWSLHNETLQFMALYNFSPSIIDGTSTLVEDWQWLIPAAPDDDSWLLATTALEGGIEALENAEWFASSSDEEPSDDDHSVPHGGGGPDPSTGNRGGVEEPSDEGGVGAELTPDDDTGVEIIVE